MRCLLLPAALVLALVLPAAAGEGERPVYPATPVASTYVKLHGQRIPDPFQWLEDDESEAVVAWDQAQMELVQARIGAYPKRKDLQHRLDAEFALGGRRSLPTFRGSYRWYTYRPKNANQPVLYRTDSKAAQAPTVVLDPNRWSGGTLTIRAWTVSPDGRYVAYRRDKEGSEDTTLYV